MRVTSGKKEDPCSLLWNPENGRAYFPNAMSHSSMMVCCKRTNLIPQSRGNDRQLSPMHARLELMKQLCGWPAGLTLKTKTRSPGLLQQVGDKGRGKLSKPNRRAEGAYQLWRCSSLPAGAIYSHWSSWRQSGTAGDAISFLELGPYLRISSQVNPTCPHEQNCECNFRKLTALTVTPAPTCG